MKRVFLVLVSLLLVFSFTACKEDEVSKGDESASAVRLEIESEASAIIEKYSLSGGKRFSSTSSVPGEFLDEDLIRAYYGDAAEMPDFQSVEAYAVYIDETKPLNPCEFGIFEMKDGADAEKFMKFLKARINLKIENAKAYPTMDTEPLTTAVFNAKGRYVWYCVVKGGNDEINKTLEGKF